MTESASRPPDDAPLQSGSGATGFVPGLELSRRFFAEAVRPVLDRDAPRLRYSAALLGPGSEVLGFDDPRSTDHDWGPRLQLFLTALDSERQAPRLERLLADRLPARFLGHPVDRPADRWGSPAGTAGAVRITSLGTWLDDQLGFDPRIGIEVQDWLATPTQVLAEITGGEVFHDGLDQLQPVRQCLTWYPDPVWRYVLACQWRRIAQEESFAARAGEAGDELGASIVTSRLVRDLLRLCLLMERRYPPYGKWLGVAFGALPCARDLGPLLTGALTGATPREREANLLAALQLVAGLHNELRLTEPLDPRVRQFHDRPYLVLGADRFAAALQDTVTDPQVRALSLVGAIDQQTDSTDVLTSRAVARAIVAAAHGFPPNSQWLT